MKNCIGPFSGSSRDKEIAEAEMGIIALGPEGNPIITKLNDFFVEYGFKTRYYNSFDEIFSFVRSEKYAETGADGVKDRLCYGITFNETVGQKYAYNLHFNDTKRGRRYEIYRLDEPQIIPFEKEAIEETAPLVKNGVPYIQSLIDTLILQ